MLPAAFCRGLPAVGVARNPPSDYHLTFPNLPNSRNSAGARRTGQQGQATNGSAGARGNRAPSRRQRQRVNRDRAKLERELHRERVDPRGSYEHRVSYPRVNAAQTHPDLTLAKWSMGGKGHPFSIPHPVPMGPRSCEQMYVEGRFTVNLPAGFLGTLMFNPQLGFLDKINNSGSGATIAAEPATTAPLLWWSGLGGTTPTPETGIPMALNYQRQTFAGSVGPPYIPASNGTGHKRWLGAEFKLRLQGRAIDQGGTVYFNNGSTGQSLVGWRTNAGVGASTYPDASVMTSETLAAEYPMTNDFLVMRAVPSTPEDMVFTDIPERYTTANTVSGRQINREMMPDWVGDVANDSYRIALMIYPADTTIAATMTIAVRSYYQLHWFKPNETVGAGQGIEYPITPDTHFVPANPRVASRHENEAVALAQAKNRGQHPPPFYQKALTGATNFLRDAFAGFAGSAAANARQVGPIIEELGSEALSITGGAAPLMLTL